MKRGLLTAALAALAAAAPAAGAGLEPVGTYSHPVYVGSVPGDANRLLVGEQAGRIMETGPSGTTLYLDIHSIVASGGEQGLLSFAFPPDFSTSHLVYVAYTGTDGGAIHVDELSADADAADPATRRPVITVPHPTFGNHNGGQLQFGPDGYLYVSTGDGGSGGDPPGNAQNTGVLLGKVLRVDPRQNGAQPYAIPPDNPFVGVNGADEIWSYGLRNPWRFSFDPDGSLVIGDVGQGAREEIDYVPQSAGGGRGSNFGWNCREGFLAYAGCTGSFTDPVFDYPHSGGACAITGGYVSRDPGTPELTGRYVYGDYCVGALRSLILTQPLATGDRAEGMSVPSLSTFGEDVCGRLYAASFTGPVYRIIGAQPTTCGVAHATSTSVACSPATVTLPASATCEAAVTDVATSPETPAGTVAFSADAGGSFLPGGSCSLEPTAKDGASCPVAFEPSGRGDVSIAAVYGGSSDHASSGGMAALKVRAASSLELGHVTRDVKRGTARLPAAVPGAGRLVLTGEDLRRARRIVAGPGTFELAVRPKGKRKRRLARWGRATFVAIATFRPRGGDPIAKTRRIVLRKRG